MLQLYCIGGDGTHFALSLISEEMKKRNLQLACAGLPKTIDNDIVIIDKSFGFETAVAEAQRAIKSAYVEAHSAENGIGLVRLMGRNAGFVGIYFLIKLIFNKSFKKIIYVSKNL